MGRPLPPLTEEAKHEYRKKARLAFDRNVAGVVHVLREDLLSLLDENAALREALATVFTADSRNGQPYLVCDLCFAATQTDDVTKVGHFDDCKLKVWPS